MSSHPFTLLLTLGLLPPLVLSAVQIQLLNGATAQETAIAEWSRSTGDPLVASIAKVKLDTDNENPLTSDPVSVTVDSDDTSGTVTLSFNRAGIFHLIAYNSKHSAIATGSEFGVDPPQSLQLVAQVTTTATNPVSSTESTSSELSSSSTESPSMMSATIASTSTTANISSASQYETVTSSPSKMAVVISSVLASTFFLLFIALLYYAVFRRRLSKSQTFHGELMSRRPMRLSSFVNRYFNKDAPHVRSDSSEYKPPVPEKDFPVGTFESTDPNMSGFVLPYSYGVANSDKKPVKSKLPRLPSMATTIATATDLTSDSSCYTNHYTFAPLTDRQMELVQTIQDLQAEIIGLNRLEVNSRASSAFTLPGDNDLRIVKLAGRIERLEKLMNSRWALGLTDDVPREYF